MRHEYANYYMTSSMACYLVSIKIALKFYFYLLGLSFILYLLTLIVLVTIILLFNKKNKIALKTC